MQHKPFVFLDIETTGGSAKTSRITEIGALRVENGKTVGSFSQLLNPEESVPYFITKLTGITDEMLWEAPTFARIADELELFLSDAVFIAHNVNFDYSFIKAEYARLRQPFNMDRFCTARLSRKLYPSQLRHNLDTLIETHGFKVANRHRALDDAKVISEFFAKANREHGLRVYAEIDKLLIKKQ